MTVLPALAWLSLVVWLVLLLGRGRYWRMEPRLPRATAEDPGPDGWPEVTAVIPARDEAQILPATLPSVLAQAYPGAFSVILVDDASSDGTGQVATRLASDAGRERGAGAPAALRVLRGSGPPEGWAGKVAAMDRGVQQVAPTSRYVLFTDSDIAHPPDSVLRLVRFAESGRWDLVSLMARLSTESPAERMIVPAFVFSFFQLYPPARVARTGARTAAAAGGCMLVRRETLERAGGLAGIADARIDDVALGTLLKRAGGRTWLGVTRSVRSLRPYPRLADLWDMIARSAYTQLRNNPLLLAGTMLGLALTYAVPPVLGVAAVVAGSWITAVPALLAWAVMSAAYLPVLRLYGLGRWRAPLLPAVMGLYGAMTLDSARRHRQGRGGAWKGRVVMAERRADDH